MQYMKTDSLQGISPPHSPPHYFKILEAREMLTFRKRTDSIGKNKN
jgi:hypothetical protein